METVALKSGIRDRNRYFRLVQVAEKEVGERIAARQTGALGSVRLECELAPGELVAHLIIILARVFAAEAERVLPLDPGEIVVELQGIVVVCVRAFRGVAD